jgi:type VI secretion system protein ImpK
VAEICFRDYIGVSTHRGGEALSLPDRLHPDTRLPLHMITAAPDSLPQTAPPGTLPRGALALAFQEAFTVAIRLRANRQVAANSESFRLHIKQLLGAADQEARRLGYDRNYVKLAVYAYIAFLDELVLNSQQPMFADWPRQPLQEEIFGDHMAGETFFRHLEGLLGQQDSPILADVLEVFQLCMVLGFRGRFGASDRSAIAAMTAAVADKIRRIRGPHGDLSPAWTLPVGESLPPSHDPWVPRLLAATAAALALVLVVFLLASWSLRSQTETLHLLVAELMR